MSESEAILNFFGALDGQVGTIERYDILNSILFNSFKPSGTYTTSFLLRSSEEEKLKNVNKVAEILGGKGNHLLEKLLLHKLPLTRSATLAIFQKFYKNLLSY